MDRMNSLVRPAITFIFALTFCFLAVIDKVSPDTFVGAVTMVLTWWFKSRDEEKKQP